MKDRTRTGHVIVLGLLILVALYYGLVNPFEFKLWPSCFLYVQTGLYCPVCGGQRALFNLMDLNIFAALRANILVSFGWVLCTSLLMFDLLFGKNIMNKLLDNQRIIYTSLVILILFSIFRNLDHWPFFYLAPAN